MFRLPRRGKTVLDLALACAIALALALLNLAINFIDRIHGIFAEYARFSTTQLMVNLLFFWLAILLGLAFCRWREESRRRRELEDIMASISPDTILVVSPERTIELCGGSVQRMFGLTSSQVVGRKTDLLYFDRRSSPERPREIYEALARDGFHIGTAKGKRMDGHTFPLEIIAGELSGRQGAVLLLRDITHRVQEAEQRRDMEARLLHRQKLESLGILAGGIAHDFNNLLAGVLGNADLMLNQISATSPLHDHVHAIINASRRAADLCREMLAYSGKGKFVVEALNLSDVVREMGRFLEVTVPKKIRMVYQLSDSLPAVEGDTAQIRQILMNLITNAADAIGNEVGMITITTGDRDYSAAELSRTSFDDPPPAGHYVFVEVSDTGCGMDDETRKKIFDPFFTTKFTGRGLGLASVQGAIRGHNGALTIISAPGEGSTFTVLLPCSDKSVLPPAVTSTKTWTGGGTALVVDDEDTVLDFATRMLEFSGFKVLTATNGREGIEVFRQHADEINVVLLDMMMPELGGEDVYRQIRAIAPKVGVILSSGYSREVATSQFRFEAHPPSFIQKPYEVRLLMEKLHEVLTEAHEDLPQNQD